MVEISPGFTFSDVSSDPNNLVTAGNLHTLIDGAILSKIIRSEFDDNSKPIYVGSTEPSHLTSDLWFDTATGLLRKSSSSRWEPVGRGQALTNAMAAVASKGMMVRMSSANSFTPTTTLNDGTCIGALAATVAGSAVGVVISEGPVSVLATAFGWTLGDRITCSGDFTGFAHRYNVIAASQTMMTEVGLFAQNVTTTGLQSAYLWR